MSIVVSSERCSDCRQRDRIGSNYEAYEYGFFHWPLLADGVYEIISEKNMAGIKDCDCEEA